MAQNWPADTQGVKILRLSVSISPRNLCNSLKSIKERSFRVLGKELEHDISASQHSRDWCIQCCGMFSLGSPRCTSKRMKLRRFRKEQLDL